MKSEIKKMILKAVGRDAPGFLIEVPSDKNHGDYSTNIALILAKKLNKNRSFVSRIIAGLLENKVLTVRQEGNARIYAPSLDAKIAFGTKDFLFHPFAN